MNKINNRRLAITIFVVTSLISLGVLGKNYFFTFFDIKSHSFNWIYYPTVMISTFLVSKFFIDEFLSFLFSLSLIKNHIILGKNVEGYWYVEWFDIIDGNETFVGNELTKFSFSNDLSYLKEISTNYGDKGEEMSSESKYQIHLNEDLQYANCFSYIRGINTFHASSRIYFSSNVKNEKKLNRYIAFCTGFEERYIEKHKGRPIDSLVIEKYIKEFGKDLWIKKLLENKGAII